METKAISKAQQKRNQELKSRIKTLITRNLMDFQDLYLEDYSNFKNKQLQKEVDFNKELINDPSKLSKLNETLLFKTKASMKRYFQALTIETINHRLKSAERNMLFPSIRKMNYFNEAKIGYDQKVNKVIESVYSYSPELRNLKIERVFDAGHRFSFLISNNEMEIHARVIYACGDINAPHYRFIVTKRNK